MLEISAGAVRAYYMFDVADTIDLTIAGGADSRAAAELPRGSQATSAYLQFPAPPLLVPFPNATISGLNCSVRLKAFDYGVMSLRLSFDAVGTWNALAALADRIRTDEAIAAFAEATVVKFCEEHARALDDRHAALVEDYFIVEIERFAESMDAESLLGEHFTALAGLLLGERKRLAASEAEEALRTRFSYHEDDLTVVQWDTAFVYDRDESARAIEDILEFANTQLLELRTYDALLDRELDGIYKIGSEKPARSWRGRREADQAESLRYLIVDILELLDRSSNALKVVGDAYYARIYRSAANRLGLAEWQRQIDTKLASIGDIYRFLSDQARSRRDEFLELIIIALIALELIVATATLFHH
ncbi:MAG: hypothetical protein JOY69_02070 [Candidatus Eremiobacteraeota bacterium]|nr:hypothetical protein [Candidatus Eremiobacteraeota bacterium]MBV8372021.1 hypothetical protein [Candidatus Eremiobacteraeota bacterium]